MANRRRWPWVVGVIVVVALGAAAVSLVVRDPLTLPGDHEVEVYALDDQISTEVTEPPGFLGRALGMCDADTYYAQDGNRKLCLVLDGPKGKVKASRKDGKVTVAAAEVPALKGMVEQGITTLVLMSGGPAALIPVTDLTEGRPVKVSALH